jgi:hypothetical protein
MTLRYVGMGSAHALRHQFGVPSIPSFGGVPASNSSNSARNCSRQLTPHQPDERDVWRDSSRAPWGYDDHGPRLACLEVDENRALHTLGCLACVDALLEKIKDEPPDSRM